MNPLCIYHGNCADGFGAAWAVHKKLGEEVDFYPGVYQKEPPDIEGRDLIFVDFSYKRSVMQGLAKKARSMLVLDHHKTAMEDMRPGDDENIFTADNPREANWGTLALQMLNFGTGAARRGHILTVFDLERSGAGLAWDFFFPDEPRPRLINHIEDRDLWRFKYPDTRAIQAYVFSFPYDFKVWDKLVDDCEHHAARHYMINAGEAIERKHFKDIEELILVATRPMKFGEYTVPIANLPYTLTSDAGHLLCERNLYGKPLPDTANSDVNPLAYKQPFAGTYYDTPNGRQFSLRSQPNGADVSTIAAKYGGGGHARASGFLVPYDRLSEFEP